MKTTINIQGNELIVTKGKGLAGMMEYEKMTGKSIADANTVTENLKVMYSYLKGFNKDTFKISFEKFIELLDEQPKLFDEITEIMDQHSEGNKDKAEGKKKAAGK